MVLDYAYSLKSLTHPSIMSHGCGFAITACSTTLVTYMVCSSSAAPTFNMDSFALALAH